MVAITAAVGRGYVREGCSESTVLCVDSVAYPGAELSGIDQNSGNAYERAVLAYLCARLNERDRAQSEVVQALNSSPESNDVRWMAALTYEALDQRDRTIQVLRDAPATLLDRLSRFPDLAELSADLRFQKLVESNSKPVR